jgi:hypothetical protein
VDTPDEEVPIEYRTETFWLTANTIERVREDLRRLGWTGNKISELDPESPNYFSMTGWECILNCTHEQDRNGKERERWSPRASTLQPLGDRRDLDELDSFVTGGAAQAKDGQSVVLAHAPGITDDDIPF